MMNSQLPVVPFVVPPARALVGAVHDKKRKILIVDDDPPNVEILSRCLSSAGYDISTASNGQEALDRVYDDSPDAVVLDVSMPVMDGLTACRKIRSDFTRRSLPIVMLTARHGLQDRLAGLRAGVDDFVGKPFDLEELKVRIQCALERRRWDLSIHPMTHLPGSPAIEEEVWRRLRSGTPFAFAYIDIDHFKVYNDAYGYEAGDRVIKSLATLLIESMRSAQDAFVGHVGGDDFVFMGGIEETRQLLEKTRLAFDDRRGVHYSGDDLEQGHIITKNRNGKEQLFPFITLSMAVISTETRRILHYVRLIEIASELKGYVKGLPHDGRSLVIWDRRADAGRPDLEKGRHDAQR